LCYFSGQKAISNFAYETIYRKKSSQPRIKQYDLIRAYILLTEQTSSVPIQIELLRKMFV